VQTAIAGLVNAAPSTLDTLKELADALGDDPNFAASTATALGLKAPLASPALTGVPTAPTAAVNTNTTQLATTAFVLGQASAVGDGTPAMDGTAARGTSTHFARADHVHPVDSSRAPLASPTFTGTAAAPTPTAGDNSTKIATTAFVTTALTPFAPLASPALTGTPTAPTATVGTNTTQLATTAFVLANGGSGGGGGHGQCKLSLSGSNLILKPLDGNKLIVNGATCTVPDAGVSLLATGLTAGTLYYIYATASAGVVNALEASTTGHATSTTSGNKGVEIKSADDTRTLVGMARPITGPAWQDTAAQRFVRSWFNDSGVESYGPVFASRGSTSSVIPTYVELFTTSRAEIILWAGERWIVEATGSAFNGTAGAANYTAIGIDGTTAETGRLLSNSTGSGAYPFCVKANKTGLSEGYHYATILGAVSSGTGQWDMDTDFSGCLVSGQSRRN
jgi:hypothetical protein